MKTRKNSVVGTGTGIQRAIGAAMLTALLSACGGSDTSCSVPDQKTWLRDYMQRNYFWSGQSPNREPGLYTTVRDYFYALLLPGEGKANSTHVFSYISDTAAYNQFFTEAKWTDFGLSVNGIELRALFEAGQPLTPLKVRYVEPASAANGKLARGDTIISINGTSAADFIAADNYSALSPGQPGQTLTLVVDRGVGAETVTLVSTTYTLTPVTAVGMLTLPGGAKAGYLSLKDFIPAAETPLDDAFASFAAQGATELILDLRYNGGGRISTSNWLASLVAGVAGSERLFTRLNYNSQQQGSNYDFVMPETTRAGYSRVVVLTGSRTCSASELIVNGLKPYVNVVTLGNTTCGKPVGFSPRNNCGSTYSAVNFESLNANGQGRYYDGITATCAAADDFSGAQGNASEKLTAAAINYLQTGACPVSLVQGAQVHPLALPRGTRGATTEPGERQGMWAD